MIIPFGLRPDLVRDGAQQGTVAVAELGVVWVTRVPVEGSLLRLEQRQQAATDKSLAIQRGSQMMRRVATGRNIREADDRAKCVLLKYRVNLVKFPPTHERLHRQDWW